MMIYYILFLNCIFGIGLILIILLYQYFLVAVYFFKKEKIASAAADLLSFHIIIPAHNEETLIGETLNSIKGLQYPNNRYTATIIADNCSDRTVEIVRSAGFDCIEREDSLKSGKSFALEWAFRKIDLKETDAIVVIDADTKVSTNLLKTFNYYLNCGFSAVQCANIVDKSQDNIFTSLFALGNLIKNYFVYYPKFKIGSSAFLLGTGMCFKKELIKDYFQKEYSVSEDIEFSLRLIKKGVRIAFAHEGHVETIFPENIKAASTQRTRWGSGTFVLIRRFFPYFLFKGISRADKIFIDTAFTLLTWSRPIIGVFIIFTLFLSYFIGIWYHLIVWTFIVLELLYLCMGIYLLEKYNYKYRSLLKAPLLIPWFFFITVLSLLGFRKDKWNRTER